MRRDQQDIAAALAGRYDVRRELGRGGMATVYLAEDLRHRRLVAIKVLDRELPVESESDRFLREIEIAARLVHPHIVTLHDSGRLGDFVYFVMPYLEGETLEAKISRQGPLAVEEALIILSELASAIDCAHRHGVVHRDVKPSNVILTHGGAVLMDFGVAVGLQSTGVGHRLTEPGVSVGTVEYMPPEQLYGDGRVDARGDLYALGCVAYEMLTGEPPFGGATQQAVAARHAAAPPPDVRVLRPTLPPGVSSVLRRAMAKLPADRFRTAVEFSDALARAVRTRAPEAKTGSLRASRGRFPLPLALVVALLLTVGGAPLLLRDPSADAPEERARASPEPRQLTFDGDVRHAYGSPDGGFVMYDVVRDGIYRLFVAEADGTSSVEVFRSTEFACCPAWSPDGTRILVRSGPRQEGRGLLIPRLGGAARPLATEVATAWSPDGERVVGWWPAADSLHFVDVDSGESSGSLVLAVPHDWINGVSWSPDGRFLAVATSQSRPRSDGVLWAVPVDGGPPLEILRDELLLSSPQWTAEGDGVYVLRDRQEVWRVPVDAAGAPAGTPVRLAAGLSPNIYNETVPTFTVSADGERLHYARREGRANIMSIRLGPWAEGGGEGGMWLTSGTADHREARLSPDGGRVAFIVEDVYGWGLWVQEEGAPAHRISHFSGDVASPSWSPDGSLIAFGRGGGSDPGVWMTTTSGGSAVRLGGDRYGGGDVSWLANGEIVYQESGDRSFGLLRPDEGESGRIQAPDGVWLYGPRGSPDGRRIAFRGVGAEGLWVYDLSDERWWRIAERSLGPLAWSPTGDTVFAMPATRRHGDPSRSVFAVPLDGDSLVLVARLPRDASMNPWDASFSPDRGLLVGAVLDVSVDAWVLDGFDGGR